MVQDEEKFQPSWLPMVQDEEKCQPSWLPVVQDEKIFKHTYSQ